MIVAGSKQSGRRRAHKPAYKRRGRRLLLRIRSGTIVASLTRQRSAIRSGDCLSAETLFASFVSKRPVPEDGVV